MTSYGHSIAGLGLPYELSNADIIIKKSQSYLVKHGTISMKRKTKERDLYKRNHLHAYESLLSLMIGNDHQHKQTTIQRSSREISEILTQFSITAAGAGIAVLFSVVYRLASRRVPFCANKFVDTGLGFSLVLLSWAVNILREVIRKANKQRSSLKGDEIIKNVERGIKEVYFRAATLKYEGSELASSD
ncbi:hypothetical protein Bca52824_053659 [Brassica carinata]|uniref:Uncharacterized protein n=1 Tax=Brassica carinata TaxID=52824 RepID=A0A8X7R4K5_BRACI|nr:hypothetical protein Bca52824_053659 [Brassica carinata]